MGSDWPGAMHQPSLGKMPSLARLGYAKNMQKQLAKKIKIMTRPRMGLASPPWDPAVGSVDPPDAYLEKGDGSDSRNALKPRNEADKK